jgi:hypothetical protein
MSDQLTMSPKEIRLIIRLLEKLRDTANHVSLTGGLADGESYARLQFNAILENLAQGGVSLPSYFPPVPPEATFGAIGIAADQTAAYLKELLEPEKEDAGGGSVFDRFFAGRDFAHIGEAIRGSMPEWMQRAAEEHAQARSEGAAAAHEVRDEKARRVAEVGERMQAVAGRMRQEGLEPEELQRLAAELSRLAQEQAAAARGGGARGAAEQGEA